MEPIYNKTGSLNFNKPEYYKILFIFYATSSCSIKTKNRAKTRPGNTSVTIGVKIGGRKDAVIIFLFSENCQTYKLLLVYILTLYLIRTVTKICMTFRK